MIIEIIPRPATRMTEAADICMYLLKCFEKENRKTVNAKGKKTA
jgi:hypothetical protein